MGGGSLTVLLQVPLCLAKGFPLLFSHSMALIYPYVLAQTSFWFLGLRPGFLQVRWTGYLHLVIATCHVLLCLLYISLNVYHVFKSVSLKYLQWLYWFYIICLLQKPELIQSGLLLAKGKKKTLEFWSKGGNLKAQSSRNPGVLFTWQKQCHICRICYWRAGPIHSSVITPRDNSRVH